MVFTVLFISTASTRCSSQNSHKPTTNGTTGPLRVTASECVPLPWWVQVGSCSSWRQGNGCFPYIALCWKGLELCSDFLHLLHCHKIEGWCSTLHLFLFLLHSCALCQAVLYLDAVVVRRAAPQCVGNLGSSDSRRLKRPGTRHCEWHSNKNLFHIVAFGAGDQGRWCKLSCDVSSAQMSCRVCGGFREPSRCCPKKWDWCLVSPAASSFACAPRCPSWRTPWCASLWSVCRGTCPWAPPMPWSSPTTWWRGLQLCKQMVRLHRAPTSECLLLSPHPPVATQCWDSSYHLPKSLCIT